MSYSNQMKQTITIELTEDQINKVLESRPQKKVIEQEMFSITEASRIIGWKKTKMYKMLNTGEIKKVIIGKTPRICREEIDRVKNISASAL